MNSTAALTVASAAAWRALYCAIAMNSTAALAVASAVAWRALYCAIAWACPRDNFCTPAFLSRYISSAHAVALVALAAAPRAPWWPAAACAIPLGYLAHDALLLLAEPSLWDPVMLGHHLAFAALVAVGPESYPNYTAWGFLAETAVPFLNLGWAMVKTGADKSHPRAFRAVSAAVLLTFFVFRVCTFAAFVATAVMLGDWYMAAPMAALTAMNWSWFAILLRRVARDQREHQK